MPKTILRKLAGVYRLKETKRQRLSRRLLVDDFDHSGFIAALNHKRQYLIII